MYIVLDERMPIYHGGGGLWNYTVISWDTGGTLYFHFQFSIPIPNPISQSHSRLTKRPKLYVYNFSCFAAVVLDLYQNQN